MAQVTFLGDPRTMRQDEEVKVGGVMFPINVPVETDDPVILDTLKDSQYFKIEKAKAEKDSDGDDSGTGTKSAAKADGAGKRGAGRGK